MRATEFIVEYKEYPTREYEGVTFTMAERDGQLVVKALNDFGLPMGHVVFNMDGKLLDPQDLSVSSKYQGQGIARVMYDYIKSRGFTIERSYDQTPAGRGFWNKHRGEDARVWEGLETGRNLNPETEKYVKDHKWKLTTVNPMDLDVDSFDDPYNRVIDIDVGHPVNFKDPIIVDANGVIIDGFHRAYQAQRAGLKTIPAYVPVEEQLEDVRVWEDVPQPGPSSGAPKQFGTDAKIQTRQMTAQQIIASVPGVPYYNNVVDDWDAKDYSWGVTKKVIEYATYLKDHPESLAKLPPAIVLNGKFEDGAHRVSALWLLQQRMDPKNPLWKNAKLNVQFVKQGVSENFDDGKNPGRKGLAKRVGVNCKQSVSKLRSIAAHSSGEKQRMAHWCANMKSGRNK